MRNLLCRVKGGDKNKWRSGGAAYMLTLLILCLPIFPWLAGPLSTSAATPVHLVRLSVNTDAGMVRIEITADSSFGNAVIEQTTRGRETVIRIRGARSLLHASYTIDDPLVRGVRTIAGDREGELFVDVVIATNSGATVAQRTNFNRLVIGIASDFAHLRRRPPTSGSAEQARRETPAPHLKTGDSAAAKKSYPVTASASGVSHTRQVNQVMDSAGSSAGSASAPQPASASSFVFNGHTIWNDLPVTLNHPTGLNAAVMTFMFAQMPSSVLSASTAVAANFWPLKISGPGASPGVWVPGTTTSVKDNLGGKPFGSGVLRPSFLFGATYDDNFFYRSASGKEMGIFTFAPRLEYELPGESRALRIAYEAQLRRLTNGHWANGQTLDLDTRLSLTRFAQVALRNHFSRSPLDPREYDPAGEVIIVGDTFTRDDTGLRVEYSTSDRSRVAADVGYNIVDWSNNHNGLAPLFINYNEFSSAISYEHDISEQTTATMEFAFGTTVSSAPLRPQFDGLNNRRRYAFEFGARTQVTDTSSLAFRAGYEKSDFYKAPHGNNFSGLIFDLGYRRNLTGKTDLELAALRKTQVSAFNLEGGNARLISTGVGAQLERHLKESLKLGLSLNYQRLGFPRAIVANSTASGGVFVGDFAGQRRNDDLYGFSLTAAYKWSEIIRARFVYSFLRRDSSIPLFTFNRHQLSLILEMGRRNDVLGRPF